MLLVELGELLSLLQGDSNRVLTRPVTGANALDLDVAKSLEQRSNASHLIVALVVDATALYGLILGVKQLLDQVQVDVNTFLREEHQVGLIGWLFLFF